MWWNSNYPFRRALKLEGPPGGAPAGHPATYSLDRSITIDLGKMKPDYSDMEVVFHDDDTGIVLGRYVSNFKIEFPIVEAIAEGEVVNGSYYIYYGNPDLVASPVRPTYSQDVWPIDVSTFGVGVSYTRPGEDWIDGVAKRRGAKATFVFSGPQIRIIATKNPKGSIAEVQLDDGEWEDVDLFSVTEQDVPVYTKTGLSTGTHTIRIRVSGRKNPSALGSEIKLVKFEYRKNLLAEDQGEQIDDLAWSSSLGGA